MEIFTGETEKAHRFSGETSKKSDHFSQYRLPFVQKNPRIARKSPDIVQSLHVSSLSSASSARKKQKSAPFSHVLAKRSSRINETHRPPIQYPNPNAHSYFAKMLNSNPVKPPEPTAEEVSKHIPAQYPASKSSIAAMAAWDFTGRIANLGVTFVVGVILTRLLTPSEFGAFAIVLSIVSFSGLFIDLGFRSAIIQARQITQEQLSTVFFINVTLAGLLIGIFWLISDEIENFYQIPRLGKYIIAASSLFALNAFAIISSSLMQKRLEFKRLSVINTVAAMTSGLIAVILAFLGYNVWALIFQQVGLAIAILVGVTLSTGWLPSFKFRPSSVNDLWSYGWKLFASGFSDTLFSRMDIFIIGKLFPIQTLGFYNRAQSLDALVRNFSSSTTTSIAFPVIANMADDESAVRTFYERCLNVIAFLSFLLIGVLFLTCYDIVVILFTDKWEPAGSYFRIMALTGFIYPLSALMVNLLAARGRSTAYLKLELVKKAMLFPTYFSFFFGGVYTFLITLNVAYLVALALNAFFVGSDISLSLKKQLIEIFKYAAVATPVTILVFFVGTYFSNSYVHLFVCSILYSTLYLLICFRLNLSGFREIFDRVRAYYNDKRYSNLSSAP